MTKGFVYKTKKLTLLAIILAVCLALTSCSIIYNGNGGNSGGSDGSVDLSNGIITEGIIEANFTVTLNSKRTSYFGNVTAEISSQGSGVVFDKVLLAGGGYTYYVLTNNHVIYQDTEGYNRFEYSVRDCYGVVYESSLIAYDPNYDLAVVSFFAEKDYKVLSFATANPKVGDSVVAIGQPTGIINAVTEGKVEKYMAVSVGEEDGNVNANVSNVTFDVIRHSAPLNQGSSGGVLLDKDYKICGINYAAAVVEDSTEFVSGYAVPVLKVKEFLTQKLYNQ
jgi:S1-C subfamily serine protease